MSQEVIITIVGKLVYFTYLRDLLGYLSTMKMIHKKKITQKTKHLSKTYPPLPPKKTTKCKRKPKNRFPTQHFFRDQPFSLDTHLTTHLSWSLQSPHLMRCSKLCLARKSDDGNQNRPLLFRCFLVGEAINKKLPHKKEKHKIGDNMIILLGLVSFSLSPFKKLAVNFSIKSCAFATSFFGGKLYSVRWLFFGVGRNFTVRAKFQVKMLLYLIVDGRHPAPVDMYNIPWFIGFHTSQVVQDFFHQQYQSFSPAKIQDISAYDRWAEIKKITI